MENPTSEETRKHISNIAGILEESKAGISGREGNATPSDLRIFATALYLAGVSGIGNILQENISEYYGRILTKIRDYLIGQKTCYPR